MSEWEGRAYELLPILLCVGTRFDTAVALLRAELERAELKGKISAVEELQKAFS